MNYKIDPLQKGMFDLSIQYALNVGHHAVELSYRTVER